MFNMCVLQAHMSRLPPPISDYVTDTRSALDNSVRLAQVGRPAAAAAAAAVCGGPLRPPVVARTVPCSAWRCSTRTTQVY
jgi:hypothetical protein